MLTCRNEVRIELVARAGPITLHRMKAIVPGIEEVIDSVVCGGDEASAEECEAR